jgi:hypothetical protein
MELSLEDMVTLLAEMVKVGIGTGERALQRLGVSMRKTARRVSALLLGMMETSCFRSNLTADGTTAWRCIVKLQHVAKAVHARPLEEGALLAVGGEEGDG